MVGVLLLLIVFIASKLTYGNPQRIAIDFGLGLLAISNVALAIFVGVSVIIGEVESRYIYQILSRSTSRSVYILSKFTAMSFICFINTLILGLMSVSIFLVLGGNLDLLIISSIFFVFLEAMIMISIVFLFSTLVNKVLTILSVISVYIFGNILSSALIISFSKKNHVFELILNFSKYTLPNFYRLNLRNDITYKLDTSIYDILPTTIYALVYVSIILMITIFIFKKKDLD